MNYKLANINEKECESIKRVEELIKNETGKDFVLIAWEKIN